MEKAKMIIEECIVVEGRDDSVTVKRAVDADTIETRGSAVPVHVIEQIKLADRRRGVIVLTDPDTPGERIRRIVAESVPTSKHAFLSKNEAKSTCGKRVGVEHAAPSSIQRALEQVRVPGHDVVTHRDPVSVADVRAAGLLAGPDARGRRGLVGEQLHIGYANGKQFLKRLHMFRIDRQEFHNAVAKVLQREEEPPR
ncbi:ribonuclease M5 [Geomicrobium halophilum]|uniref:Ribonuclease M5 n=1 Tax=Geomicrobium halophilum TaxID=549000 RepID=A0A841PW64_9BACL|nr:ribonuclease M5 [Geomicrobium halophilum]MBB6451516.1 ribonuclease M5 [Geomicrobium halophilum]